MQTDQPLINANSEAIAAQLGIDPNKPIPPEKLAEAAALVASKQNSNAIIDLKERQAAEQAAILQAQRALAEREKAGVQTANDKLLASMGLDRNGKSQDGGGGMGVGGTGGAVTSPPPTPISTPQPDPQGGWLSQPSILGFSNGIFVVIIVILLLLSSCGSMMMMFAMTS